MIKLNGKVVNETTVVVAGIDMDDYPKFCDGYFESAQYEDGTDLTDDELEQLLDEHYELFSDKVTDLIF